MVRVGNPLETGFFLAMVLLCIVLLASPYYLLSPLPPLALLAGVLFSRYPAVPFYMIVFLIPFGAYRDIGGVKIHWLLGGALILILAVRFLVEKQLPKTLNSRLWIWIFLYLLSGTLATLFSPYRELAIHNLLLTLIGFVYFSFTLLLVDGKGYRQVLPGVLVWSISLSSLLAALGQLFGISLFAQPVGTGFTRATGGALDPNNLSLMVIFAIPLLIYWTVHAAHIWERIGAILLIAINLAAIVSTYSRGGLLILCFAGLVVLLEFLPKLRPIHVGLVLAGVTAAGAVALITVPDTYWARQATLGKGEDFSLQRRTSYVGVAWEAFKERPL